MNTRHEGSDDGAVAGDEALEHGRLEGPSAGGTRGRTVEICGMENLRANCAFWSPTFFEYATIFLVLWRTASSLDQALYPSLVPRLSSAGRTFDDVCVKSRRFLDTKHIVI